MRTGSFRRRVFFAVGGLLGNQRAGSCQLQLVLPTFGDFPLFKPLGNRWLTTTQHPGNFSLRAKMIQNFLRRHMRPIIGTPKWKSIGMPKIFHLNMKG